MGLNLRPPNEGSSLLVSSAGRTPGICALPNRRFPSRIVTFVPSFVFPPFDSSWQAWSLVGIAGFSVGVAAGSFENLVKLLYGMTRRRTGDDEELCSSCTGFGTVRCMVCYGAGTVAHTVGRKVTQRRCSACLGSKRERYDCSSGAQQSTGFLSFEERCSFSVLGFLWLLVVQFNSQPVCWLLFSVVCRLSLSPFFFFFWPVLVILVRCSACAGRGTTGVRGTRQKRLPSSREPSVSDPS